MQFAFMKAEALDSNDARRGFAFDQKGIFEDNLTYIKANLNYRILAFTTSVCAIVAAGVPGNKKAFGSTVPGKPQASFCNL